MHTGVLVPKMEMTVAQIRMLESFTKALPYTQEVRIVVRHLSGNVILHLKNLRIRIEPNGDWRVTSMRTGDELTRGAYLTNETNPLSSVSSPDSSRH